MSMDKRGSDKLSKAMDLLEVCLLESRLLSHPSEMDKETRETYLDNLSKHLADCSNLLMDAQKEISEPR
jgi:hypothetical protein